MKNALVRLVVAVKAVRQLGPQQSFWYALYQAGLRSGYYRRATPTSNSENSRASAIRSPFHLPESAQLQALLGEQAADVLAEAGEILAGQVRLFGGPPVPLQLAPAGLQSGNNGHHWTYYEGHPSTWGVEDIKLVWEPARFGWAYTLGRAYRLTGDERYPEGFWKCFEMFQAANPANQGPNWMSAQEVALRLIAFLFAAGVFAGSPHSTPGRMQQLAQAVADHARRIPPTLSYARAQNNNHLISEALGLYAAGNALPEHPQASTWQQTGWFWLNRALREQIQKDGTYAQHSMNYHRLMLHAALLGALFGKPYPKATLRKLAAATRWLLAQVDPLSGRAPNLGNNDGALILPLAPGDFSDYRATAQAAARGFLGRPALPDGPWNELGLWLGQACEGAPIAGKTVASNALEAKALENKRGLEALPGSPAVHRLGDRSSWATLRAVHFDSRPAHADQLHVEIWWDGENIARDAGTFRYTAPAPWDNALAETPTHNTVSINRQNQMVRAGRFLWLDWAQADVLDTLRFSAELISAEHDGYQHLGVIHRRTLKRGAPGEWQITDYLRPTQALNLDTSQSPVYLFRVHWLLPDWPWKLIDKTLSLTRPDDGRQVRLALTPMLPNHPLARIDSVSLARAGKALSGPEKIAPVMGWFSPTYNLKIPALSFSVAVESLLPFTLLSTFSLDMPNP